MPPYNKFNQRSSDTMPELTIEEKYQNLAKKYITLQLEFDSIELQNKVLKTAMNEIKNSYKDLKHIKDLEV